MISILLPCYNSTELLQKVFSTSQFSVPVEIVMYDNGGNVFVSERDKEKHFEQGSMKLIGDGENVGLNVALNRCAQAATYDLFYLCHTDMSLLKGWDTALVKAAEAHAPGTYLFCSRSIESQQGHTPFHLIRNYGQTADEFVSRKDQLAEDFKDHRDHHVVTGYRMPFFLDRKLWDKMGGVDPHYFSYATDDDLFMTAYDVGVRKFWMIFDSLVYHMQGQSNAQQSVDRGSQEPYNYFRKKWTDKGYDTNLPIDDIVRKLVPWNITVR